MSENTATTTGAEIPHDTGLDVAGDAFLARLLPPGEGGEDASKKKPSNEAADETNDEQPEAETTGEEDDQGQSSEDGDEAEGKPGDKASADKKYVEDDTVYTKVKVGEEEHEVPVKDLKRLWGQEAALTRRSQEIAKQREAVQQQEQQYGVALTMLTQRAEAKAAQFRGIDFMSLARDPNVTPEQIAYVQEQAQQAFQEETYFKQELGKLSQAVHTEQQRVMAETAAKTVKELNDPASPYHIEGFNKDVYGSMVAFAKSEGIAPQVAESVVDAPTLKILHYAMLYKKGLAANTKPVIKTPKKIVKTSQAPKPPKKGAEVKQVDAMSKLRKTGRVEDAENAFLANWAASDANE